MLNLEIRFLGLRAGIYLCFFFKLYVVIATPIRDLPDSAFVVGDHVTVISRCLAFANLGDKGVVTHAISYPNINVDFGNGQEMATPLTDIAWVNPRECGTQQGHPLGGKAGRFEHFGELLKR